MIGTNIHGYSWQSAVEQCRLSSMSPTYLTFEKEFNQACYLLHLASFLPKLFSIMLGCLFFQGCSRLLWEGFLPMAFIHYIWIVFEEKLCQITLGYFLGQTYF